MNDLSTLDEQLLSSDEEVRRQGVIGLASHPLDAVAGRLFAAMGDASWRVRKEAVNRLLAMAPGQETVEGVIDLLRSAENAGLRNSAVEALERLGSRAVPQLLTHCSDEDHDVRKFVIDILGNIGDRSCIATLVTALADPDANVSAAAAENLGKIGDSRAVPPLLDSLSVNDVWFRYSVLEALARIGEPVPLDVLAPLAADNLLKRAVFECLGAVGGVEAVPLLVEGLREKVRATREAAACALGRMRGRLTGEVAAREIDGRLAELKGSPFVEGLISSLEAQDRTVREALVTILGIIGDERAAYAILQGCRDERLRRSCIQAFRCMGERSVASLLDVFPAADEEERCYIAHVWGETGFRDCEQYLREGVQSGRAMLRRASVVAIGKIGMSSLIGVAASLLDDSDPDVRESTVDALVSLAASDKAGIQSLAHALATSDAPEGRANAASLFAAIGEAERLSLLVKDVDSQVRRRAVAALAGLALPESVGSLAMALVDEDPDVRLAAATGLGEVDEEGALEPLLLSLNDDDPWVQCAALRSLGRWGGEKVLGAIERLIDTSSGVVLITCLETLAGIEGGKAEALVKKVLDNPDEEVVKAAIDILSRNGSDWVEESRERLMAHPHWDVRTTFVRTMAGLLGERSIPYLRAALEGEQDDLVRGQIRDMLGRWE